MSPRPERLRICPVCLKFIDGRLINIACRGIEVAHIYAAARAEDYAVRVDKINLKTLVLHPIYTYFSPSWKFLLFIKFF